MLSAKTIDSLSEITLTSFISDSTLTDFKRLNFINKKRGKISDKNKLVLLRLNKLEKMQKITNRKLDKILDVFRSSKKSGFKIKELKIEKFEAKFINGTNVSKSSLGKGNLNDVDRDGENTGINRDLNESNSDFNNKFVVEENCEGNKTGNNLNSDCAIGSGTIKDNVTNNINTLKLLNNNGINSFIADKLCKPNINLQKYKIGNYTNDNVLQLKSHRFTEKDQSKLNAIINNDIKSIISNINDINNINSINNILNINDEIKLNENNKIADDIDSIESERDSNVCKDKFDGKSLVSDGNCSVRGMRSVQNTPNKIRGFNFKNRISLREKKI